MKKKQLIATLFSLSLVTPGCGSDAVDRKESETEKVETENKNPEQTQTPEGKTPAPEIDEPQTPSESSYIFEKTLHQTENTAIYYPQIRQFHDQEKEEHINQLIKEEALFYLSQYDGSDTSIEMDYEMMTETPEVVSIVYTGYANIEGGMYPSHKLFTTNLDLVSGKKLKPLERYTLNDAFIETLQQGIYLDRENPFQPNEEKAEAVFDYLNSVQNQELIEALKQADHPNLAENTWEIFTYQTFDELVVSLQVPHALGDHAEIILE